MIGSQKVQMQKPKKILDIGCGEKKYPGSIGIDVRKTKQADIVANIEKGLPFKDNGFDLVYSSHTLEHIDPKKLVFVIEEIWRITKPSGIIKITVPHFSGVGAATNPTHLRPGFASQTFHFFKNKNEYQKFGRIDFEILKITLGKGRTRNKLINIIWLLIENLANLNPLFCEIFWVYWFGGFHEIQFDLKPIKKKA